MGMVFIRHFTAKLLVALGTLIIFIASPSFAQSGDADVIFVKAEDHGDRGWTFHVTVEHPDTGWDDYCNGWDVLTEAGEVLKNSPSDPFTRLLLHPHENEQPFTRSQGRLKVPSSSKMVTVRAHDIVDGWGGKQINIDLSREEGDGYSITRN